MPHGKLILPLFLLSACATSAPQRYEQMAIPVNPLVAPRPLILPAPVALPPPLPIVVSPEEPTPKAKTSPDDARSNKGPPPAVTARQRPECEPLPPPHRGGDALHNKCADEFPPNRFPGKDVLVDGKRFDALQVDKPVLWEIKTDRFEEYTSYLKRQVIQNQVPELRREREIAEARGFGFIVGVSSTAHQTALLDVDPLLKIVVTDC